MKLNELTLTQALTKVETGEATAYDFWQACQAEIGALNPDLNAYLHVAPEKSFSAEKAVAQKNAPLHGLPIALKDNFCTTDMPTTASSAVLDEFRPPYDATVITRLRKAGASFLGKTNMDAWAHGSSTETSDFGPTKNPRNPQHIPGGSSGGSAAAVAANLCLAALGSETAGSIRNPAALCGVVGFRPSYGRSSRYGIAAMASSTDTPGFLTKTVADAAYLTNLIAGEDPYDATTISEPMPDLTQFLGAADLSGLKIGVQYIDLPELSPYKQHYLEVIKTLTDLGASVEIVSSLDPNNAIAVYTIIQRAEVSSNLGRYDGVRYGHDRATFGDEAKHRIMLGTYTLSKGYADKYYLLAQKVRTLYIKDFQELFKHYDVLISPPYPGFAPKIGASAESSLFGELEDLLIEPSALSGLPAISIPCYRDPETNLYLGLQILAAFGEEGKVIQVADAYERHTPWNEWRNALNLEK